MTRKIKLLEVDFHILILSKLKRLISDPYLIIMHYTLYQITHCTPFKKDKHRKPIKKKKNPKVFKLTKETKPKSKQTDPSGVVWVHCSDRETTQQALGNHYGRTEEHHVWGIRLTGQTRYQAARAQLEKHWGTHRPVIQLLWRLRSLVSRKSGDVAPGRAHGTLGLITSPMYNNQEKRHCHRQEHSKGKQWNLRP